MKLYEITDALRAIMGVLSEPAPPVEAGEAYTTWLQQREAAQEAFDAAGGDLKHKLRAYVAFATELRVEREARAAKIDAIKANVIDKMLRQNERDAQKEEWLLSTARAVIDQFEVPMPLKFAEFTVALQKLPRCAEVVDPALLPAEYKRIVPEYSEPDKRKILADLKEGVVIAGARLSAPACKLVVK
jgi:hypothetical protein